MREVKVYVARDALEAHFFRGLLEAQGIRSIVKGESLAIARGDLPLTQETLPSVWVLESDAPRALEVAATLREPKPPAGAPWICEGCGQAVEPQFTQCWNCGDTRPNDPAR